MNVYPGPTSSENEPTMRASLWHRARPSVDDQHTSLVFWFTVLGLGCVALLTAAWGGSSLLAQKGSEKLLRIGLLLPKLKSNHVDRKVEAFPMPEAKPNVSPPLPKDRTPELPALIDYPRGAILEPMRHTDGPEPLRLLPSAPGPQWPPRVEDPPPPIEACHDPVVYLQPCTPHPGDTPMIRNWKTISMYSLLSAAMVMIAPPQFAFAQEGKDGIDAKDAAALQKSIQDLIKRIDSLEKKKAPAVDQEELGKWLRDELKTALTDLTGKVKKVGEDVQGLKASVDKQKTELETIQGNHTFYKLHIEKQKAELDKLALDVEGPRKKLGEGATTPPLDKAFMDETRTALKTITENIAKMQPTKERLAMSPPINGSANMGRVMIVNLYSEDLLFLINGNHYVIPAGKSRLVPNIPSGPLQYRVHSARWGKLIDQSTTLAADETFTLTAAAQR